MIQKHQKGSKYGKVRVNNTSNDSKYYVVANVVCKKMLKNAKKSSKTGKVRVRNTGKFINFKYFQSKSEIFNLFRQREGYKKLIFDQKVSYDKELKPNLECFRT